MAHSAKAAWSFSGAETQAAVFFVVAVPGGKFFERAHVAGEAGVGPVLDELAVRGRV